MKIFKYLALSAILVSTINNSQAQLAVAVASNTDPTFLAMAAKSIASQGQMISQMADTVSSLQTNYQSISSSKDITSKFAAFGNMFGNMSAFMNDHVCAECTPEQLNQWAQLKVNMKKIDGELCQSTANVLNNGNKISETITSLAQDISSVMNTRLTAMTPAQSMATQAKLLGALGGGVQQTNILMNSAMQMQTAQNAKENMAVKNAQLTQEAAFKQMKEQVKP
mgnify:CR=1 FL=1